MDLERAALATPVVPPPERDSDMFLDESGEVARVRVPVESTSVPIAEREPAPPLSSDDSARVAAEPAAVLEVPQAKVPIRTWLLVAAVYVTVCYAGHVLLTFVR